jgi:serine/threonine protein kinase
MGGTYSLSSGGAVYRFGRRIGRGGMGEVYLGLQEGMGGLERLVVIKRIYPQFGEDEHFTGMLLQEARLAASIRHPNVVQIHDIGRDEDGYFIAMEYLSGETLVYVTRTLRSRNEPVPPAVACRIGAEVAAGLHCAHTATDPGGNPQPIVHRDVTPSNLIVCFNGAVKIVDFGVAKATLHEGHTRGGVKGKMSYLAPEQLYDQPIDGRTDVFQLGICLHEALTGGRLFKGSNDQERAVAVLEQAVPPPSELVENLPKELDEVVLWALQREPDKRPESADELRKALETAAGKIGAISGHDLGAWMKTTFTERLAERTHFERQCVAEMRGGRSWVDRPSTPSSGSDSGRPSTISNDGLASSGSSPQLSGSRVTGLSQAPSPDDDDSAPPVSRSRSRELPSASGTAPPPTAVPSPVTRWIVTGIVGVSMLAAGVAIAWRLGSRRAAARVAQKTAAQPVQTPPEAVEPARPAPPRHFDVAVTVDPADAEIELDGVVVGRGSLKASLPVDGARHRIKVRADGYEAIGVDFTDQPPPARVVLDPAPAPAPAPARRVERPSRRSAPPPPKRVVKPRPKPPDESSATDNPDPWADESSRNESEKGAGGSP